MLGDIELAEHQIIPMERSQRDTAAEALSLAFIDDPFLVYINSNREKRQRWSHWFWRTTLGYGLRWGVVETIESGKGAAVWLPPGNTTMSSLRMMRTAFVQTPFRVGLGSTMRIARMDALDKAHARQMPEDHWYLQTLGVHPDLQGTGVGSALLDAGHARAEESGKPCYLETATQYDIDFYSKRGYESAEQIQLDDLTITTMIRR